MIDALVNEMLLGHEFVIGVLAVAMEIEDGLTFVLEFFDILADAGVGIIEFLVPFLPRIEYDGFEKFLVLRIRLNGFQELDEFLLEYNLLNGFGVRAFLASVMIVRMALPSATTSKASGQWLTAMLANNKPPQGKIGIIECARLAFEMKPTLHALALSE